LVGGRAHLALRAAVPHIPTLTAHHAASMSLVWALQSRQSRDRRIEHTMVARAGRARTGVESATTGGGFPFLALSLGILLAGFLVAISTPPYVGYVQDARTVEARLLARSLWTVIQSHAMASCGPPSRGSQ